jgi:hypothetical protein
MIAGQEKIKLKAKWQTYGSFLVAAEHNAQMIALSAVVSRKGDIHGPCSQGTWRPVR